MGTLNPIHSLALLAMQPRYSGRRSQSRNHVRNTDELSTDKINLTLTTCCFMVGWLANFFSHPVPAWEVGRIFGLLPASVETKIDLGSQRQPERRLQVSTSAVDFRRPDRLLRDNHLQTNNVEHACVSAEFRVQQTNSVWNVHHFTLAPLCIVLVSDIALSKSI